MTFCAKGLATCILSSGDCTHANTLLTYCVIIEDIRYLCFDMRFWFWFGGLMNTDFIMPHFPKGNGLMWRPGMRARSLDSNFVLTSQRQGKQYGLPRSCMMKWRIRPLAR